MSCELLSSSRLPAPGKPSHQNCKCCFLANPMWPLSQVCVLGTVGLCALTQVVGCEASGLVASPRVQHGLGLVFGAVRGCGSVSVQRACCELSLGYLIGGLCQCLALCSWVLVTNSCAFQGGLSFSSERLWNTFCFPCQHLAGLLNSESCQSLALGSVLLSFGATGVHWANTDHRH
jgi:hypothetical protein